MTWMKPQTEEQWTNSLSAYLDGEMEAEERAALETWLSTCPERQRQLETLQQISSLLPRWTVRTPEPSPAFIHQLVKAEENIRQPFWRQWFGTSCSWLPFVSGAVTGICALFLVQVSLHSGTGSLPGTSIRRESPSPMINVTLTANQAQSLMNEVSAASLTTQLQTQLRKNQWRDASFTYQTLMQNYSRTHAFQDIQQSPVFRPFLNKFNSTRSI